MDIHTPTSAAFRIGLLLIDEFALMSYSSAQEPLRAANLLSPGAYELVHISVDGDSATSSSGATIRTVPFSQLSQQFDLILIVAGGDPFKFYRQDLSQWLHRHAGYGALIGGVSGGPVILSRMGLMDGYRMTMHWEHSQTLAEMSPNAHIERSLYVFDRNRLTCAGGTAPLDMMHALITRHHGADFARSVSDWFLHTTVRASSAPQRAGLVERYQTHNQSILTAIEIMENHIATPLELNQLALIVGLGVRQLNRLFKQQLGISTIAFYRELRLDVAENMLVQSDLSITNIAIASGFNSSAHFSSVFKQHFGLSPSARRLKLNEQ